MHKLSGTIVGGGERACAGGKASRQQVRRESSGERGKGLAGETRER